MKTTSISIWYRKRAYGVRTALETCLVQERGLWGTNYSPEHVWYRRGASGVQTALRNVFGTGDGPLGYEPHSETCSVQERGLWGTNRTRNVFGIGEGPLGYEPHSKRVRYGRRVSGVRTALETCSVQEKGLWGTERIQRECRYKGDVIIRLTITILTEIFDNYEELQ